MGFTAAKLYMLDEAGDIVHDVFIRLWTERQYQRIDRDLRAYLFTLCRFRIVDQIRKNAVRESYAVMIQALAERFEASAEQQLAVKELQQTIEQSLNVLSPRVIEIFRLSREQQLSIPEIAQQLGLSEQTVKNQLSAALKHLRASLVLLSATTLAFYLFR
jgi:RNA polymerase sigma-70 factor (family 1)